MNTLNQRAYESTKRAHTEVKCGVKAYAEHKDGRYYAYYDELPADKICLKFTTKYELEYFLYRSGIEKFVYKSSNGKLIEKVFKYKNTKEAQEDLEDSEEKYDYHDFCAGHFVKNKEV